MINADVLIGLQFNMDFMSVHTVQTICEGGNEAVEITLLLGQQDKRPLSF